MAAASSAASTGIEPGERDGHRERDATEIIESKEIYRGFIALRLATLRLADGARASREIIEHGKAAAVLPYGARRAAVMLVLARVGLFNAENADVIATDYISLTTFGIAHMSAKAGISLSVLG